MYKIESQQVPYDDYFVSVVIPSHKRVDHLTHCLRAIRNGTSQPIEILVVDKSFNHKAKKVCETYSATYITCRGSITQALNKGIKCARTNLVAFTDDDSIPNNRWVEFIIKSFRAHADVGVVGGPVPILQTKVIDVSRIVLFKITLISTVYNAVVLDGKQGKAIGYLARSGETVHSQKIPQNPIYVDYVKGCNMAVRRDAAIRIGCLSTFFVGHSEYWEVDFCKKIRNQGFGILFDPQVKVVHKIAGSSKRPFFDRCYNYTMFFLMNRKKANLSFPRFFVNLAAKNAFYLIFPLLKRNANWYVHKRGTLMPLISMILALKDYLKSRQRRVSHP